MLDGETTGLLDDSDTSVVTDEDSNTSANTIDGQGKYRAI